MASGYTTPDGKMYGPEVAGKAIKEACADYESATGTDVKDYGKGGKQQSSGAVDLYSSKTRKGGYGK
jgi:hypothetical protein